ncbi:2-C-methyl-D-erythritol 2,4-cyclodiphosphate synthase [Thermospira aquatica]|uniref:2-C-methyl-D-erythritol 2,4-cyclodiphosphate synthase n=1 Tax=Thermospira aquatica TaxID=2828656 RepID=A0AAX3BA38_9SPIR|nr:2-C-methyl-D-erythritol 2,4-cyclodiphosphate synthase [Thermospira aquatica]URA09119.1 2-C-methyl-D-erythritol 2,4-cyclodiphosphate synthase [Thermospira aquatica]
MFRVGLGYDLHRLAPGLPLWIGGVAIESAWGCIAHSDGDVLIHALIDALVGPFAHTDIGSLFPDSDPRYKQVRSVELLTDVVERFLKDITIHNIDVVIILDQPKLSPYRDRIRQTLADILGISLDAIHVKAKTSEKTSENTISCYVVALLEKKSKEKNHVFKERKTQTSNNERKNPLQSQRDL